MISGLYTADNNQTVNFDRPVKAVAIDPKFGKHGSGKNFVTGDDKVRERERKSERKKEKTETMRELTDRHWKNEIMRKNLQTRESENE